MPSDKDFKLPNRHDIRLSLDMFNLFDKGTVLTVLNNSTTQGDAAYDPQYADFVGKVASGRRLDPSKAEAVAQGQIWTGADAKDRGLVDALGGWSVAIQLAKETAGSKRDTQARLVSYPSEQQETAKLVSQFLGGRVMGDLQPAVLQRWATRLGLTSKGLTDILTHGSSPQHLPEVMMPPLSVNGVLQ